MKEETFDDWYNDYDATDITSRDTYAAWNHQETKYKNKLKVERIINEGYRVTIDNLEENPHVYKTMDEKIQQLESCCLDLVKFIDGAKHSSKGIDDLLSNLCDHMINRNTKHQETIERIKKERG